MIHYLPNADIDYDKWDACIEASVNGLAYAYSWYLDIVAPDWEALVMDDYEVVMPLPKRKKWGITYLFQPLLVQQLGVFSPFPLNQVVFNDFLGAIPKQYQWIDGYLNEGNNFTVKILESNARSNYLLFLNKPYEQLYQHYHTNTRRNLKKAQKQSLTIQTSISPDELVAFFQKTLQPKLHYITDEYCRLLLQLIYRSVHRGCGITIGVYDEVNQLCSAAFFLDSHYRLTDLAPATNQSGRENGAMFFLLDSLIRKYANSDYTLDFEGSMVPSVARFYKGFGGLEVNYWHIRENRLPWWAKWIKQ